MTAQPTALRLAELLEERPHDGLDFLPVKAAAELRRLAKVEAQRKPLTAKDLRDVLRQVAESIDAPNIVMTHWPLVARAIEAAHGIKEGT